MTLEEEVKKLREEMELVKEDLRIHARENKSLAGALLGVEKQVIQLCKLQGYELDPSELEFLEKVSQLTQSPIPELDLDK